MKRITLITTLILATLASTTLRAHAQYTAYDLGTGVALDINSAGTVVGCTVLTPFGNVDGSFFRYSGGAMAVLGPGAAYSVNSVGSIVGTWSDYAFIYSSGHTTYLGTLGGLFAGADAINDAGTIVGVSDVSTVTYPYEYGVHAFSYSGGVMTDLGTLGGSQSAAWDINNAGTIVGQSDTSGGAQHAFSYSNGHMTDLGLSGSAYAINDGGTIVGGNGHAFSYGNGHTTDLGTLGGSQSAAYDINNAGTIVGQSDTSGGAQHAFSYSGGVMTDLEPWLSSIGLTGTSSARAINDNGDIVGYGTTAGGSAHAFLLAVPEPNSIAILGLGLFGLTWLHQRPRHIVPSARVKTRFALLRF